MPSESIHLIAAPSPAASTYGEVPASNFHGSEFQLDSCQSTREIMSPPLRNGGIPSSALCSIARGHALRCDAAAGYTALADAYRAAFGSPLCITDSYRSLGAQVTAFRTKPALAAVPGTSNHGWGLAVDLCGGIHTAGTVQSAWMAANAGRFGFVQPDWARPGGEKPEPWHWEFGHLA